MKKLATLLLAAGMVVASTAPANAVDVKLDYRHRISFDVQSKGFKGDNKEEIKQRVRLGLTLAASENLAGYIQLQTGKESFGHYNTTAGSKDAIQVRQMFIDWKVPATNVKVRMGRQMIGFPNEALGHNSVMDAGWGGRDGIVVTAPVNDWLGLTALWARSNKDTEATNTFGDDLDNNRSNDIFGIVANAKFDAVNASVYAAYANIDNAKTMMEGGIADPKSTVFQDGEGSAYWVGATATLMAFDPFTFALSFAYGSAEADGSWNSGEQEGWNVQAKASYKLDFGTPVLGFWYGSGMDESDLGKTTPESGIMPSFGGYIAPTRSYNDNAFSLNGGHSYYLPSGNWGVQLGIEDVSFLQDLSHTFLVTYMQGTNEDGKGISTWIKESKYVGQYLTEEDSLVSFDLVSTYKIYKNLAAHLELAYIINDFDNEAYKDYDEDDWRAALTFDFKF